MRRDVRLKSRIPGRNGVNPDVLLVAGKGNEVAVQDVGRDAVLDRFDRYRSRLPDRLPDFLQELPDFRWAIVTSTGCPPTR